MGTYRPTKLELYEIVARCPDLTPIEKSVLVAHLSHADPDGTNARPGNIRLGVYMGKSEDWMKRTNAALVRKGWLVLVSKGFPGRASVYAVKVPEGATDPEAVLAQIRAEGDESIPATGGRSTPLSQQAEGQQVVNPPGTGGQSSLEQVVNSPPHQVHAPGPCTRSIKNTRSPEPTDRPGKPEGKEAETLPDNWRPNPTHLRSIEKTGGDPGEMVDEFRRRMKGENRTDWGATFGEYINQSAQGREDDTFPHCDPDEPPGPELPSTWARPEWLTEAHERVARVMAGHPADDAMSRALADYLDSCARLGREPSSLEFPQAVQRYVTAV